MKILGVGGVFIRTKNVEKMIEWYDKVLEVNLETWNGTAFVPNENNMTIFSLFDEKNNYFPAKQRFMMNFQIDNMDEFMQILIKLNVKIVKDLDVNEYGKFIWIEDPDGNWVEVWER
jgi:predicted enzyme related to lactoylglutathione lyase